MPYKLIVGFWLVFGVTEGFAQPTWNQNIAPIIFTHCTPCHHAGGSAPFALDNYRQVAKRSKFVAEVVHAGYMPPWKADVAYRHFAGERVLTPVEKQALADWVALGAPKGSGPEPKSPVYKGGTQLASLPSLVLQMEPFTIPGGNQQTYICTAIPYELPQDTFVQAVEYLPGNVELTHHVSYQFLAVHPLVNLDSVGGSFVYGEQDFLNDAHDYGHFGLIGPDGSLPREVFHMGWLPGASPTVFEEGSGFFLPKRGVLLIRNLHYAPTPIPATDQAKVLLHFAQAPVTKPVLFAAFKPMLKDSSQLVIPANERVKYEIKINVPQDLWVTHINPHMHQLGQSFKVWALPPNGDTIPLVHIPRWDFNWQDFYRFQVPVHLPKGSFVYAEAWFDNTANNPSNPFSPPKPVWFERGMDDEDEMMRLVFLFTNRP